MADLEQHVLRRHDFHGEWNYTFNPRQFIEIWENRRCSILFHLLVPGGRWHTVISRPVWSASGASSVFHNRVR